MELSYTLRICFGCFFILVKDFVCQSSSLEGMCLDEYQANIIENGDQGNVLFVCTSSLMTNETDTVYMDMAKVPKSENSTCYCTVTFTNENVGDVNIVRLNYTIGNITDALTVNGYGFDRFSMKNDVHVVETTLKVNNITFKLTSPKPDFQSCLRITSTNNKSLIRARCYTNDSTTEVDPSSTKTATTQSPSTSTKFTMENGTGSTLSLGGDTDTGSDSNSPSGVLIGGAAGGGAVLVIIIVIVIVVLVIKRKKTKNVKAKNEDYYMTENDLYNVRNSSIISAKENTNDTYDEIEAAKETRESRIYAQVDKNRNKPNANT